MARLGQHFLKNPAVVRKAVERIDPQRGDLIIEIGPGHGALTVSLIEAAIKEGAEVVLIEKDPALAQGLQKLVAPHEPHVSIIEGDAREALPRLIRARAGTGGAGDTAFHYKLAGNIPYYITGALFRIIGELMPLPEVTVLMVQEEVAERVTAQAGEMNRLAASVQFWGEASILARVPRRDFSPPPKVDSALIALTPRAHREDSAEYYSTVRALFAQPRKTILNNVAAALPEDRWHKEGVAEALRNIAVDPAARAEVLSIAQIGHIAEMFGKEFTGR